LVIWSVRPRAGTPLEMSQTSAGMLDTLLTTPTEVTWLEF